MEFITTIKDRLIDYWELFLLSIPKIAIAILIVCAFTLIGVLISKFWRRRLSDKEVDNRLVVNYVIKVVRFLIILAGLILALHTVGFSGIAGGLLAGAGVGAIILGFAFKEIGENFIAGVILVFDRPFSVGDIVTINNNMGKVVNLLFRSLHIKTLDGKDVYIPNSKAINSELYNHTKDGFLRHEFIIGIDYNDDIELAKKVALIAVNQNPKVLKNEKSQVLVDSFGTNAVNLKVLFWVLTKDYKVSANAIKSEVMRDVKNMLQANDIGLPANIQEVKMYNKKEPILVRLFQEDSSKKE